jgi:hypothetical protein
MSLLLQAHPVDAPLHPFLAGANLDLLPAPLEIDDHALLYLLGPTLDLLVEADALEGMLKIQWQVRLPTLPADPTRPLLTFPHAAGADVLPCGLLPDPGPADAPLGARARQAFGLVFSPEARTRIRGLFALARLAAETIRRRSRLAVRSDGAFSLSAGPPPATRVPLLAEASPEEHRRLVAYVGGARALLHGKIVHPAEGVDMAFRRSSAHERLADLDAATRLLDAAGIPAARIPSRTVARTSI